MSKSILRIAGVFGLVGVMVAQAIWWRGDSSLDLLETGYFQVLPASDPAWTIEFFPLAAVSSSFVLRAQACDLPGDGTGWPVLSIGDEVLSFIYQAEAGFIVSWVAFSARQEFLPGEEIEILTELHEETHTVAIYVNERLIGILPYDGSLPFAATGLAAGEVELEGVSLGIVSPSLVALPAPPENRSPLGTRRLANGDRLIRAGGKLISRQQAWQDALAALEAAGLRLPAQNPVFLDWEAGDDRFDGTSEIGNRLTNKGPKKTWAAAKAALKAGGIFVINGNNGIYTDDDPYAGLPSDVTIIALGDMLVGTPATVSELFTSGRWRMTEQGPLEALSDP
jgi:hypothetical protein